ncbi:MAG: response regulator transcription factor [Burkholderiales bacterium]|nr:response regulator transcription factor [Burkholderiales bacterium]
MTSPAAAASPKHRILVADDHALVREGIGKVLSLDERLVVAGEAVSASDVLSRLKRGGIDLVLLDLLMPGATDVDLIKRVVAAHPKLPVLVLTMHADPHIARRALEAGALGYLTKDASPELLVDAVHHVLAGRSYVDPSLSGALIRGEPASPREQMEQLSTRERQVLVALVTGRSVMDIAEDLQLAPNTVSTYKGRLMEKLGQASLSDLVRYAMRHGLVD